MPTTPPGMGPRWRASKPKTKTPPRPKVTQPKPLRPTMHAPVPADPLQDPGSYINRSVSRLGTPQTDEQIQSSAMGMLNPLVQQIRGQIQGQAEAGTQAIGGYTSNLAKALSGYQQSAAQIYGGAQQSQAASDAALASRLSGGGEQMAADLSGKLASINAPSAVGQTTAAIQQTGTGSGNALYANGSAALADLIARGAAEQSYAAKLPGLAGLAGAQQTGQLQGKLQTSLADQLAQVQTQVPGIVQNMQGQRSDLLNRQETLRATLASDAASAAAKQTALKQEREAFGLTKKKTIAGIKQGEARVKQGEARIEVSKKQAEAARVKEQNRHNEAVDRIKVQRQNATTAEQRAAISKRAEAERQRHNKASEKLKKAGSAGKAKLHGLTPNTYQKHAAEALGAARHYHVPQDKGGASWQQYLTAGQQQGIPTWILIEQGKKVYSAKERKLNTYAGGR